MSSPAVRPLSRVPNEREVLEGLGVRWPIPPFAVRSEPVPTVRTVREGVGDGQSLIDGVVTLSWSGTRERFAVEYKAPGTPRQVEAAIMQLRRYLSASADLRPLIVAPYLKPELLERLVEEGISAVDLSGNMAITVPGRWLVIRSGSPNRYRVSTPIKNIYRGKSALVCRALLLRGQFPTATTIAQELRQAAGVTLPTVSKVLAGLDDELIVSRDGGIRLTQPAILLDKLSKNFAWPNVRRRLTGKLDREASGLAPDEGITTRFNTNAQTIGAKYAVDVQDRYAILPSSENILRVYVTSIDVLATGITIETESLFPDIELVETDDPGVFFGRVWEFDTWWISPLQSYLQLASGGKREQQAAAQIRNDLLTFKYSDRGSSAH